MLSTEEGHFTRGEAKNGWRLSCQTAVKQDLKIEVPQEFFGVKRWECEVISNENVATFIKELVLRLPEDEEVNFRAGGYVQFEIPPYDIRYKDMIIEEEYQPDWKKFSVFDNESKVDDVTVKGRASVFLASSNVRSLGPNSFELLPENVFCRMSIFTPEFTKIAPP